MEPRNHTREQRGKKHPETNGCSSARLGMELGNSPMPAHGPGKDTFHVISNCMHIYPNVQMRAQRRIQGGRGRSPSSVDHGDHRQAALPRFHTLLHCFPKAKRDTEDHSSQLERAEEKETHWRTWETGQGHKHWDTGLALTFYGFILLISVYMLFRLFSCMY